MPVDEFTTPSPTDVVRNSFSVDKRNSRFVAPARVELTRRGYCVFTITKNPGERARTHKVLIEMRPNYKGQFNRCPEMKFLCDCARNKFVWNFAHDENGIAIRNVTNGEPPVVTNPEEIPGACKHLIVAIRFLMNANPRWTPPPAPTPQEQLASRKPVKLTDLRDAIAMVHNRPVKP